MEKRKRVGRPGRAATASRNGRRSLAAPAPDRRPAGPGARSRGCGLSSGAPRDCLGTDSAGYPPTNAPAAGPLSPQSYPSNPATHRPIPPLARRDGHATERRPPGPGSAARAHCPSGRTGRIGGGPAHGPRRKSPHLRPGQLHPASVPAATSAPGLSRFRFRTPRDEGIVPERLAGRNKKCRLRDISRRVLLIKVNKQLVNYLSTVLSTGGNLRQGAGFRRAAVRPPGRRRRLGIVGHPVFHARSRMLHCANRRVCSGPAMVYNGRVDPAAPAR